jgi:hypothetical protein
MERAPEVEALYQEPLRRLHEFGPVTAEEKKTSIHLNHRAGFASGHPLQCCPTMRMPLGPI